MKEYELEEIFRKNHPEYCSGDEVEHFDLFLEGYNKANEWHYVKDGVLPKHENYVLVTNGKDWTKGFYKDKKWNIISLVGFLRIIAWKEIVLPELKES